jgi:hypothetical protein
MRQLPQALGFAAVLVLASMIGFQCTLLMVGDQSLR